MSNKEDKVVLIGQTDKSDDVGFVLLFGIAFSRIGYSGSSKTDLNQRNIKMTQKRTQRRLKTLEIETAGILKSKENSGTENRKTG